MDNLKVPDCFLRLIVPIYAPDPNASNQSRQTGEIRNVELWKDGSYYWHHKTIRFDLSLLGALQVQQLVVYSLINDGILYSISW